jgi:hypothetical protein
VRGEPRWRTNWRIVGPAGATEIRLPASRRARRASARQLRELPLGTDVVLVAASRGGRRCKALAAGAGIAVERTYLAFPSAEAPAYLVEDEPEPLRVFLKTILVVPPRSTRSFLMLAGVRILRSLGMWRLVRAVAPGRLLVGRRA